MKDQGRHLATATLLVIVSSVAVYFAMVQMFPLMVVASVEGQKTLPMFTAHYVVIAFLFSLITVFLLYSAVVFRRKEGEEGDGYYTHGNTALEIAWTVAPIGIVLVFAVWGSNLLLDITSTAQDDEAWVVNVRGFKWGWAFEYPEVPEVGEVNEFIVPVGRPVLLNMESDDVIHSFWVPEFHVKQDLLPGVSKQLRFQPTMTNAEIAEAHGDTNYQPLVRCAEICGTSHAYMLAKVSSMSDTEAAIQRVITAGELPSDPVERGAFYYENLGCNQCHSLDGSQDGYAGPTWLGIYEGERALASGEVIVADDAYITSSIYDPNGQIVATYAAGVMPQNFEQQFADKTAEFAAKGIEVDIVGELIQFMQTLE